MHSVTRKEKKETTELVYNHTGLISLPSLSLIANVSPYAASYVLANGSTYYPSPAVHPFTKVTKFRLIRRILTGQNLMAP